MLHLLHFPNLGNDKMNPDIISNLVSSEITGVLYLLCLSLQVQALFLLVMTVSWYGSYLHIGKVCFSDLVFLFLKFFSVLIRSLLIGV